MLFRFADVGSIKFTFSCNLLCKRPFASLIFFSVCLPAVVSPLVDLYYKCQMYYFLACTRGRAYARKKLFCKPMFWLKRRGKTKSRHKIRPRRAVFALRLYIFALAVCYWKLRPLRKPEITPFCQSMPFGTYFESFFNSCST